MIQLFKAMYYATNENLYSIVDALKLNKKDIMLAVCGSGDQVFAMLEKSPEKIIAVDINEDQLKFAKQRADFLKANNYNGFLRKDLETKISEEELNSDREHVIERNKYFEKTNLETIKKNLHKIEFVKGDIFDYRFYKKVSKIYLSNCKIDDEEICNLYISRIPVDAEIYITDTDNMLAICLAERTKLCKRKTEIARSYYKNLKGNHREWWPAVFKN